MADNQLTGRGGAGRGQGRKSLPEGEKRIRAWAFLTTDQITELKRIGDGNLSEGIRRLLTEKGETR